MSTPETVGDLAAENLGSVVSVTDGGSRHAGELVNVEHSVSLSDTPRSMITLRAGEWRHIKGYPSDTPIEITPPGEEHTP